MINFFLSLPLFLCWGSFLNVIACRLLSGQSLFDSQSRCPSCSTALAWYDLIPIFSWLFLKGKCRYCKQAISWLYPIIELVTAIIFSLLLYIVPPYYWFGYSLFFTALVIVVRTDLQAWLIPQYVTIYFIPLAIILSYYQLIPISVLHSLNGSFSAYIFLWLFASAYYFFTKRTGIGQGDIDLLSLIGAFIGLNGWWFSLTIASITASILGLILFLSKKLTRDTKLPFGPFLVFGAIVYVLCNDIIATYLFQSILDKFNIIEFINR